LFNRHKITGAVRIGKPWNSAEGAEESSQRRELFLPSILSENNLAENQKCRIIESVLDGYQSFIYS
jgi:hypothetical protein